MTTPDQFADLLDDTMQALAFDATPPDATPATDVLTRWTDVLGEGINTGELTESLTALRATISEPTANPSDLEPLLNDIATQVTTFSANVGSEGDMVTRLQALATALQDLAGKLHAASQA